MELKTLKCPQCDATLEVEDGIDTFYCKYCGSRILLDGQSPATLNAKIRVKELENEKHKRELKYKKEKAENKHATIIGVSIVMFFALFILIMVFFEGNVDRKLNQKLDEIHELMEQGEFDRAQSLAESIYYDGANGKETQKKWDNERKAIIKEIKSRRKTYLEDYGIPATISSGDVKGMNYEDAEKIFKAAGFKDIKTVKLNEKPSIFVKVETNGVAEVSIARDTTFKSTDKYLATDPVIISYYGLE